MEGEPVGYSIYQHVKGNGLHGIYQDGVWCCNQPNFSTLHPSNSETDFVSLNIVATITSCPSFWIVLEQWFLFVTPTAVELSVWIGLHGCGHPMSMRVCQWGTILQVAICQMLNSSIHTNITLRCC